MSTDFHTYTSAFREDPIGMTGRTIAYVLMVGAVTAMIGSAMAREAWRSRRTR